MGEGKQSTNIQATNKQTNKNDYTEMLKIKL